MFFPKRKKEKSFKIKIKKTVFPAQKNYLKKNPLCFSILGKHDSTKAL